MIRLRFLIVMILMAGTVWAGTRGPFNEAIATRTLTMTVDSVVNDSSYIVDTSGALFNMRGFTILDYYIIVQLDSANQLPGFGNDDSVKLWVQVSHGYAVEPANGATGSPAIMGTHWHTIDSMYKGASNDTLENHWYGDDGDSVARGDIRIITYIMDSTSDTTATQNYFLFYWFYATQ